MGVATTASNATWLLCYRGFQPDIRSMQVAVIPTGGLPQHSEEASDILSRPTFQVLVRGAGPLSASTSNTSTGLEQKVDDVISALNLFSGTLLGRAYKDIQLQGEPISLGRDENARPMYSVNFLAFRSRTT